MLIELHPLSLHDALPIYVRLAAGERRPGRDERAGPRPNGTDRERDHAASAPRDLGRRLAGAGSSADRSAALSAGVGSDRKSTRLNSSHVEISYAVFCLKK